MSHSHTSILVHVVFATKGRAPIIPEKLFSDFWAFTGGIARTNGMRSLTVGGIKDHMHVLLSLPATIPVSKAVQLIKAGSSRWMNNHVKVRFDWQEGYGAFTVGVSQKDDTVRYIKTQGEHHKKSSFQDEYAAFLRRHGLEIQADGSMTALEAGEE